MLVCIKDIELNLKESTSYLDQWEGQLQIGNIDTPVRIIKRKNPLSDKSWYQLEAPPPAHRKEQKFWDRLGFVNFVERPDRGTGTMQTLCFADCSLFISANEEEKNRLFFPLVGAVRGNKLTLRFNSSSYAKEKEKDPSEKWKKDYKITAGEEEKKSTEEEACPF